MPASSSQMITCVILIVLPFYQVSGQNVSIIRGERDVFTNLVECGVAEADCYDTNCTYCQCKRTKTTYIPSRRKYGECVANEYLAYVTSFNFSFLAQETKNNWCLYYYKPNRYSKRIPYVSSTCNSNLLSQRWLWTRNGQLFNLDILNCITVHSKSWIFVDLLLSKCDANRKNQIWECDQSYPYYVRNKEWNRYLSYIDLPQRERQRVGIYTSIFRQWKRYGSNQALCAQAVGCQTFKDGSSVVVLNQTTKCDEKSQCVGRKEIDVRKEVTECYFLKNQTQYLHKDEWQPLLVETEGLAVVINGSKILLQWNLIITPKTWKGIIVKVHFKCEDGAQEQKYTNVYCVLIKYTGRFTGFEESSDKRDKHSDAEKDEPQTAVIIVCILLIVLVAAIAAFLGYKNKNRLATFLGRNTECPDSGSPAGASFEQPSGTSNNPIYNSSDKQSAENICELYEATESGEHVYQCANDDQYSQGKAEKENLAYDYAIPEGQVKVNLAGPNPSELENVDKSQNIYYVLDKEDSEENV